jgi:hypothetical protein
VTAREKSDTDNEIEPHACGNVRSATTSKSSLPALYHIKPPGHIPIVPRLRSYIPSHPCSSALFKYIDRVAPLVPTGPAPFVSTARPRERVQDCVFDHREPVWAGRSTRQGSPWLCKHLAGRQRSLGPLWCPSGTSRLVPCRQTHHLVPNHDSG